MDKTLFRSTLILIIVHFFGLIGTFTPWRELFLLCTPISLIISAILLFINHKNYSIYFLIFCVLVFLSGYILEVVGVATGKIFGVYTYGPTLGYKQMNVPLVIGLNWLILVYSVGVICNGFKMNPISKCLLGSVMLVALDYVIEPVAVKLNFWTWQNGLIPMQNYVAWFIASMILLILFYLFPFNKENKLAKAFYIIQLVFFILLNIF